MKTLRYRILKSGIRCAPWGHWRGEIKELPVSGQTMFKRDGRPLDLLEAELAEEGWITSGESLLELLRDPASYSRGRLVDFECNGEFPDDWTEEDYRSYFNERKNT